MTSTDALAEAEDARRARWTVPMTQAEIDDLDGVYWYDDGYVAADDVQRLIATLDAERARAEAAVDTARDALTAALRTERVRKYVAEAWVDEGVSEPGYATTNEMASAILAELPPDWCGHTAEVEGYYRLLDEGVQKQMRLEEAEEALDAERARAEAVVKTAQLVRMFWDVAEPDDAEWEQVENALRATLDAYREPTDD
jgi:hypothetical protein